MLIDEILATIQNKKDQRVEEVVVGISYTGVKLELDKGCGVAYTLSKTCFSSKAGSLTTKSAKELAKLATSPEPLPSSIGVAAINALINIDVRDYEVGNPIDFIDITKKDIVGMIGFFQPLIKKIKEKAGELYIFERKEINGAYPDWAIYRLLPKCNIVIITGATIINKTIDSILALTCSYSTKEVCIIGASTPLLPQVFRKYGVTMLAGIRVTNPKKLMQIIKEGGGVRNFGKSVEKIILR